MITQEDCRSLQNAGAEARAAGKAEFDCPLYKPENMPATTGEDVEVWALRHRCWILGWKIEDTIRSK